MWMTQAKLRLNQSHVARPAPIFLPGTRNKMAAVVATDGKKKLDGRLTKLGKKDSREHVITESLERKGKL